MIEFACMPCRDTRQGSNRYSLSMTLTFISILPYFLILTACFVLASRLHWLMPADYFARAETQKYKTIEGLRSLLALSVFFHHGVITYYFYQHGRWEPPPSVFFTLLGGVSVNLFFLITGFLFWGKAIQSEGKIGYATLLRSRIRRIAPAYMASVSIMLAVIFFQTGSAIIEPLNEILINASKWLFGLGFLSHHPINGIPPYRIGAGVFWTLRYEWKFYLALPIIAVLLRKEIPKSVLYTASMVVFGYVVIYQYDQMPMLLLFLCGMACAAFNSLPSARDLLTKSRLFQIVGLASILSIFLFFGTSPSYMATFLLSIFFLSLIHLRQESVLFKLLQTRAAKILGACSYSTYVLHGVILYVGFAIANIFFPVGKMTPMMFWALMASLSVIVVIASVLSYRFIEHPFIAKKSV